MKKLLAAVLTLILVFSSAAICESIDYSSMTDEQLQAVINSARSELAHRSTERKYLIEDEYVRVYNTGNGRFGSYEYSKDNIKNYVEMEVVVENLSCQEFELITDGVSINGWETDPVSNRSGKIGSGMKKTCYIELPYTEANLTNYTEMKDVVISLHIGGLFENTKEYKINLVLNQSE